MGFADRVIARAAPEQRAITEWGSSAIPGPLGNMAMGGGSYSSVDLRRSEAALQKVAVWSSIDLIAGVASQLPLQTFRAQPDGTGKPIGNSKFVDDPGGEDQGCGDWVYQYLGSKLMRGNTYGQRASYDPSTGYPTQIVLYHPDDVKGSRDRYTGVTTWRVYGLDVPAAQMWHRRAYPVAGQLLGLSPIGQHATTIGQGISAARFGMQFFTDGGHPSSMLVNTEEEIDQTKATIVKARWMSTVWGSREPIVMGRGWDHKALTVSPEESQFLETQKFTGAECCRIFGPNIAEILGYETGGSMTYANQEQRAIDFLKFTLNRWLRDVEAVFTRYLPRPQYVRFDRRVLLETDLISRYQAHKTARDIGLSNIDELRGMEDLSPLPNGQGADYTPLLIQVAASRGIDAAQVHAGEPPADQPVGQRSAEPDPKDGGDDLDEASAALLVALYQLDVEWPEEARAYDPAKHARIPKGQPGGGQFMSMVAHIKAAIEEHVKGGSKGDPFEHFNREQLRKVAKARGHDLPKGISREDIAKMLLDDLGKPKAHKATPAPKKAPKAGVALSQGRDEIGHVPDDVKKLLFSSYKAQPHGQLLTSTTSLSYENLLAVAHVYGEKVPGGLSVLQATRIVDEQLTKNQGLPNKGFLEKKLKDWLATPEGAGYVKANFKPEQSIVDTITGKVTHSPGIKLKPGQKVQKLAGPGAFSKKLEAAAFKEHQDAEMQALQDAYLKERGITWTPSQVAAIKNYSGGGYSGMNGYLRDESSADALVQKQVADLQSAMVPVREHTLVLRGTGYGQFPEGFRSADGVQKLVGKTIIDQGFMSTSVAGSGGHFSYEPVHLSIEVPKGTPAVFLKKYSYHSDENELLLAAGSKFRVISATQAGGEVHVRLRVVTPK